MTRRSIKFILTYRTSIAFLILSLISGALNYLFYPLISRLLSVEDFGSSQALITLLTQIGSLFAGLSILSIFFIRKYDKNRATKIINLTQKIIIAVLLFLTLLVGLLHSQISNFLNIEDGYNVAIVAIDLALSIPFIVTFGIMLAERRFLAAAFLQISVVSSKLILGLLLVPSFQNGGAIAAIGLSYIVGMAIYWIISKLSGLNPWGHNVIKSYVPPTLKEIKAFKPYTVSVFLILFATSILVILPGIDVLIARHHLDASSAGIYSAASTISSLLLFACMPVINILVPLMNQSNALKSITQLKKAGALLSIIAISSMSLFVTIPTPLLGILGEAYTGYAEILWIFGLNMLFICVLTLLLQVMVLYKPVVSAILSALTLFLVIYTTSLANSDGAGIISATATSYGIMVAISTTLVVFYVLRSSPQNESR